MSYVSGDPALAQIQMDSLTEKVRLLRQTLIQTKMLVLAANFRIPMDKEEIARKIETGLRYAED